MSNLTTAITLALLLAAGVASAADPVTDAMQKTYGPYRVVLFKTNSNSQTEAQQALSQAQQSWGQIVAQFAAAPPAPYDRDPAFSKSLSEVSRVYQKAADEISKNQLSAAHETLEHARDVMADMRHRNQVIVYSDHMNAYHAQMELLINDGVKTLTEANGQFQLSSQAGVLAYLSAKLHSEAPTEYAANSEFNTLYKAVDKSVADLKAALIAQDASKTKDAIGQLKVPYSKMFIKFG